MNETDRRDTDFSQFSEANFRSFMKVYFRHRLELLKADNFETLRVVLSEILVNRELRELYYQKIVQPTMNLAEKYFQQWAEQHLIKPFDTGLTVRAISGMVLGLILEYILGDETLQERWDELPDFLTTLIMEGAGSVDHDKEIP
jgi:hypothetical protein